jgi:hypothetical protein
MIVVLSKRKPARIIDPQDQLPEGRQSTKVKQLYKLKSDEATTRNSYP